VLLVLVLVLGLEWLVLGLVLGLEGKVLVNITDVNLTFTSLTDKACRSVVLHEMDTFSKS